VTGIAGRRAPVLTAALGVVAWLAAGVGTVVLAGWALDIAILKCVVPGSVPMKANTAVAFILAGAALGLTRRGGGRWAAAGVLLIGAATLSEYVFGWDLHIDQLLFNDLDSPFRGPGRMAFTTAASFLVLGTALMLASSRELRLRRCAEILGGIAAALALFEIEGYVLDTTGLAGYGKMAVPTALVLPLLSIATIMAVPDGWLVARAQAPGVGGILTRRLLPIAIGLSMALGKASELMGWHDPQSVAVVVILGLVVLSVASLWCVATIEAVERMREVAEAALRDTEAQFRWFFEKAPVGKLMVAPDGKLLRVNRAFCAILGYSPDEMQKVSWMDITHPDDLAQSQESQRALLAGEADTREMEKRYRAKDGRWVWTRVSIGVHRDPAGRPLYFLTHVRDVSERREAAERQAVLVNKLQAALGEVKTLRGILPICANCKRVHNEQDGWEQIESYVRTHTHAEFSHGLCPDCARATWGTAGISGG
jgi:PAS domain S-box-containing protein